MSFPGSGWPSGSLQAAARAFEWLCCPPQPLTLDCRGVADLPPTDMPLGELRELLLHPETATAARDAVWRKLIALSRTGRPEWKIAAVGMALPALRRVAGALRRGCRDTEADLDGELLTGFLDALAGTDLDRGRICARLVRAGASAARRLRDADAVHVPTDGSRFGSRAPARPWDHPDLVLVRAVAGGVISGTDANLIATTRLDRVVLATAATSLGLSAQAAQRRRSRAEQRLVLALRSGELSGSGFDTASGAGPDGQRLRNGLPTLSPTPVSAASPSR